MALLSSVTDWQPSIVNLTIRHTEDWSDGFQLADPATQTPFDLTGIDEFFLVIRPRHEDDAIIRRLSSLVDEGGEILIENASLGKLRFFVPANVVQTVMPVNFKQPWQQFLGYKDGAVTREIWRGNFTVLPGYGF